MEKKYRFKVFFTSLLVGTLLALFFLNKKGATFNYLPNSRVINEILKKEIIFSKDINYLDIDTSYIKNIYLKKADINFSKSEIIGKENPIYFIENKHQKNIEFIKLKNYKSSNKVEILFISKN